MTPPLEHDYIGLSETPPMGVSEKRSPAGNDGLVSLRETELSLGLPGSGNSNRKEKPLLTLGQPKGVRVPGSKRGFADAIDAAGNWVLAGENGYEVEIGKGLFSPKADAKGSQGAGAGGNTGRDGNLVTRSSAPERKNQVSPGQADGGGAPAAKAQVVGWPPIRSYRKNTMAANPLKATDDAEGKQGSGCLYVKVSMDGAPYLRKVDLKMYGNYKELSLALGAMFSCFTMGHYSTNGAPGKDGLSESRLLDIVHESETVLTYEDKDGDWMLVGDVPWDMFTDTCRRLRIMKGSEAVGLAPRVKEKTKNHN